MRKLSVKAFGLCLIAVFLLWQTVAYVSTQTEPLGVNAIQTPELREIRVGVLVSGSVHWLVETIVNQKLDVGNGILVKIIPLGSVNALLVALQGNAVDVVVSDWMWVSEQSERGRHFYYSPYSSAMGGVVVPTESKIIDVAGLVGKRIAVAGGPEGKTWSLLKSLMQNEYKIDLETQADINFVAPPLVNVLLKGGKVDAGINFWHFNSVLDQSIYTEIMTGQDVIREYGVSEKVPMLGWVFRQSWAKKNSGLVDRFLVASQQAAKSLKESDEAWSRVEHLLKPEQKKHSISLRDTYRDGMVENLTSLDIENIKTIYSALKQTKLKAKGREIGYQLNDDIFWPTGELNE